MTLGPFFSSLSASPRFVRALILGVVFVVFVGGGSAQGAVRRNPRGKLLGLIAVRGKVRGLRSAPVAPSSGGGNLLYNGGPVMRANTTHAIFWSPAGFSMTSSYRQLVDRYLTDVAAASGSASNVYATDTEYFDSSGKIANASAYAGAVSDTQALPASGCVDPATSVCLTDAQIQAEINRVITSAGLPRGLGDLYFLITPQGVGSCGDASATDCAYTTYCAYHSGFGPAASPTLYANIAYGDVPGCSSGSGPNGDPADATINLISHEHNEAITDPLGTGWFDANGAENGDKCANAYGAPLGSTQFGSYNQAIAAGTYQLQAEWSNTTGGCALNETPAAPPPPSSPPSNATSPQPSPAPPASSAPLPPPTNGGTITGASGACAALAWLNRAAETRLTQHDLTHQSRVLRSNHRRERRLHGQARQKAIKADRRTWRALAARDHAAERRLAAQHRAAERTCGT